MLGHHLNFGWPFPLLFVGFGRVLELDWEFFLFGDLDLDPVLFLVGVRAFLFVVLDYGPVLGLVFFLGDFDGLAQYEDYCRGGLHSSLGSWPVFHFLFWGFFSDVGDSYPLMSLNGRLTANDLFGCLLI